MHLVAIAILNYNGRNFLEKFLPFVLKHSEGHPVYVIDNLSTDNSVAFLESSFPEVHLIQLDENTGFTGGYNKGLQFIQSKYYVLLNSDIEVAPGWLPPLLELMESDKKIAACQPKILSYTNRQLFEHAGAAGGYIDRYGYPFCRGRIFDTVEEDKGQYDDNIETFWATGACMMIDAKAFRDAGGFDDRFFAHMEEIDLCWRLKNRGYKVYAVGKSHVYHVGGGTLPTHSPRKTYLNFRNSLWMLFKNSSPKTRLKKIAVRILLDCIAMLRFAISGQWPLVKAVGSAILDFLKSIVKYKNNSIKVEDSLSPVKNLEKGHGIFEGSIVMAYFMQSKKRFSALKF